MKAPAMALVAALLLVGCTLVETPPEVDNGPATVIPPEVEEPVVHTGSEPSVKADLRLKRWRQLSLDLQGALVLTADQVCKETGLYECTDLHVVPLGGVSVDNGLFDPVDAVSVTTGLAIERVVMQACFNRLQLDRERVAAGGEALVFTGLDLAGQEVAPEAAEALVTDLYHRLLARDPEPEELAAVVALHAGVVEDGGGNAEWAVMSCFALATTTEALMY